MTATRALTLAAVGTIAAAAVVGIAPAADAAQSTCATRTEYRHIERGQSVNRVAHIMGGRGKVVTDIRIGGEHMQIREWRECGRESWHVVSIDFRNGTVHGRAWL